MRYSCGLRSICIVGALLKSQVCLGQGRSGGGRGGGRSRGGRSSARSTCFVSHCSSCEFASTRRCRTCHSGFALDPTSKQCLACPQNCKLCFAETRNSCNQCIPGFFLSIGDQCARCSEGCELCLDQNPSSCKECFFWRGWSLNNQGEGCSFSYFQILIVYGGIAAILLFLWSSFSYRWGIFNRRKRKHLAFVSGTTPANVPLLLNLVGVTNDNAPSAVETIQVRELSRFPSGTWRGYYSQNGLQHAVCEFQIDFFPGGRITGGGRDRVGKYTLQGCWDYTPDRVGRVAFTKRYKKNTANSEGWKNTVENQGHAVEYQGSMQGRTSGSGIRGTWSFPDGADQGSWHLWPVEEGWQSSDQNSDLQQDSAPSFHAAREGESECCVCYDGEINCRLDPCGHIAVCHTCARKIERSDSLCPLCRRGFAHITILDDSRGEAAPSADVHPATVQDNRQASMVGRRRVLGSLQGIRDLS